MKIVGRGEDEMLLVAPHLLLERLGVKHRILLVYDLDGNTGP